MSASGKLPFTIFFETQDDKMMAKNKINELFIMIFLNIKKRKLNNIYNKIVKQSKQSFYLRENDSSKKDNILEFFQLNLIIILWYMKSKKIDDKYINYLINKFIKDLEHLIVELGFSETSIRKKIRIILENFYGRLYSYSQIFDEIIKKKKNINFKKLIKRNFKSNVNQNLLDNYLNKNIKYFNKLDLNDFWDINFFLERE